MAHYTVCPSATLSPVLFVGLCSSVQLVCDSTVLILTFAQVGNGSFLYCTHRGLQAFPVTLNNDSQIGFILSLTMARLMILPFFVCVLEEIALSLQQRHQR